MNRRYRRMLMALVVATAFAAVAPRQAMAGDDPKRDALSLARERLEAARTDATDLSEKISAAQTAQAKLEAEIADAEQTVPALRAKADFLRLVVKQRAVELYVGHDQRIDALLQTQSVVDGARAALLTGNIATHDRDLADDLRQTAQVVEDREAQLRAQRADLVSTVDSLAQLQDELQKRLAVASAAYAKVKEVVDDQQTRGAGSDIPTGATRCPVHGFVAFTDDFGLPRPGGFHPGVDMSAVAETPVVAVVDGFMRHDIGGAGGFGAWLLGTDGVGYYYAHFSHYQGDDRLVLAGDVIGYVGMTGNATGPHLHFELHPVGLLSPPIDPYPLLLSLCLEETARALG